MRSYILYLIDGVAVPRKIWYRRQECKQEHAAAQFEKLEVVSNAAIQTY